MEIPAEVKGTETEAAGTALIEEVAEGVRKTDRMLEFLGEYNYDAEIAALKSEVVSSAQLILTIGCRLLRIKEHEPWGRFNAAVEASGLNRKNAHRFMSCALRFVSADTGKVKYPLLVQMNATKIYDLAMLDDEDLEALEKGGSVSGINLDDIDRMSTRELRSKLREAKADKETYEAVVRKKDEVINGLEFQLAQAESSPSKGMTADEIQAFSASIQSDILEAQTDANIVISKFRVLLNTLRDAAGDNADQRAIYRTAFVSLRSAVQGVSEEVGRLCEETDFTVPESAQVDAGFMAMGKLESFEQPEDQQELSFSSEE